MKHFYTFGCTIAEVYVDQLTGEIFVNRVIQVFDVGKVLNKKALFQQVIGGTMMGVSTTLFEELIFDGEGRLLNPNLTDYKVGRAKDAPAEILCNFLENPSSSGPYGARGIGETPMIGVPAAIGNAVQDAIGVSITSLPLSPEKVMIALKKQCL